MRKLLVLCGLGVVLVVAAVSFRDRGSSSAGSPAAPATAETQRQGPERVQANQPSAAPRFRPTAVMSSLDAEERRQVSARIRLDRRVKLARTLGVDPAKVTAIVDEMNAEFAVALVPKLDAAVEAQGAERERLRREFRRGMSELMTRTESQVAALAPGAAFQAITQLDGANAEHFRRFADAFGAPMPQGGLTREQALARFGGAATR